jgi:hypothetical protein
MTDNPIHDLEDLLAAFGVESVTDLEWAIEEASDIYDGRNVFIDDRGPEIFLGIGTRGWGSSSRPTSRSSSSQRSSRSPMPVPICTPGSIPR